MRIKLKITCLEHGMTQRRLATIAGINEKRMSDIVCGVVTPDDDERRAIVDALGLGGNVDEERLFAIDAEVA